MAKTLKNVSILTTGEARGHNLFIDEQSLKEALAVAQSMGRIKVTNGHGATQVLDILGYVENFKIQGNRLLGDLTLLDSESSRYVEDLAKAMPDQFGLSITFTGEAREVDGKRFASVTEIYDVSMVPQPAANKSLFSAFSTLPVDTFHILSMEKTSTTVLEAAPQLPAAPAVPAATFNAEEAFADLTVKFEELSKRLAEITAKLEHYDEESCKPHAAPVRMASEKSATELEAARAAAPLDATPEDSVDPLNKFLAMPNGNERRKFLLENKTKLRALALNRS